MDILSKLLNPVIAFVMTLLFGFWLSRRGKPYNGLLFNIHKLVALAAVIVAAMVIVQALQLLTASLLIILALVLVGMSIIALFASGALMSANKGEYQAMKLVHNISPFILVLGMAASVYLLEAGR